MDIGVFGDGHLSRNLPHTTTDKNGKDVRYNFQNKLLKKVIKPFKITFHAGDLTDTKNNIDGKILEDAYKIFNNRRSIHILGNHDRSEDGNKYTSMVEFLSKVIPEFEVVTDIEEFNFGSYKFICCSYYSKDEDIKKAVKKSINDKRKVIVLGHFHFYDKKRSAGRKLYQFAKKTAKKGVLWLMGHEHNPSTIRYKEMLIGHYIGVMNPKKFREKQGKIFAIPNRNKPPKFFDYPMGEKFIISEYKKDNKQLPKIEHPERTYLKIKTDDLNNIDYLNEKYGDIGLRYFSTPYEASKDLEETDEEITKINKTEEDYVRKACDANEYNADELMPYHNKIKELV